MSDRKRERESKRCAGKERAHASHPPNRIVGGGMLWCALALLVSQPPHPASLAPESDALPCVHPHAAPLKGGRRIAARLDFLSCPSRARVALRASVAMRPPQRWNGLPEDANRCSANQMSSASHVNERRRIAARLVLCRARRARGLRCAHRSLRGLRAVSRLPEDAHHCATSTLSSASRAGVALRASVAMLRPQGWAASSRSAI